MLNLTISGGKENGVPALLDQACPKSNHCPLQGEASFKDRNSKLKNPKLRPSTFNLKGFRARDNADGQCEEALLPKTLQCQPDLALWS